MSDKNSYAPDWAPENGGDAFAVRIKKGISPNPKERETKSSHAAKGSGVKRSQLSVQEYIDGVLANSKPILARAITLIESNSPDHYEKAREVLKELLPHAGQSLRVGITGVPGAGKSTFIETLGCYLLDKGFKVAVLAIDPSSSLTRGSILGDKTRMEKLSRRADCFIRPSPSGGTLGGVTRKTRETMLLCEAAGYDVILVETIGVGQSEVTVRSMVDFFLLVLIAGAGDELQAIKRGVMEIADAVLVNKADGNNKTRAEASRGEYAMALKYLPAATRGWETEAHTCSALTGEGIPEIWKVVKDFEKATQESGVFQERRNRQSVDWVFTMIEDYLKENFYTDPSVKAKIPEMEKNITNRTILPTTAAEELLKAFYSSMDK